MYSEPALHSDFAGTWMQAVYIVREEKEALKLHKETGMISKR
jgi:hypothetical protein